MRRTVVVVVVLLAWAALAVAQDGFSLGLWPDERAPYVFAAGSHSFGLGFGVEWELGLWWYRGDPPAGYSATFTTATIEPSWSVELFNGWALEILAHVQYRTNRPDYIELAPRLVLFHPW